MPRKARIHYSHAMYHVMNQGNFRQAVFFEKQDFQYAYKLLERIVTNYGCKLHLFCLMTNHFHLLIEVDQIPLSRIMQSFTSSYSKYINKKRDQNGHLFRGRFKDKLVQDERYVLELCYYIHNNPLAAKMVNALDQYPWSSHHCYSQKQSLSWVTTNLIMGLLSNQVNTSTPYIDFMLNRDQCYKDPEYCRLDENGYLVIGDSINAALNSAIQLNLRGLSLNKIVETICNRMDISLGLIQSGCQRKSVIEAKLLITYFAHYHGHYTFVQIALMLNAREDSLSKTLRRHFESGDKARQFKQQIKLFRREFLSVCSQVV